MSGGRADAGVKGGQAVMGSRRPEFGGDEDISSGCGTDEGRVGYGKDRDGDGLNWWEDMVANVILGTEPNVPLAYVPGL